MQTQDSESKNNLKPIEMPMTPESKVWNKLDFQNKPTEPVASELLNQTPNDTNLIQKVETQLTDSIHIETPQIETPQVELETPVKEHKLPELQIIESPVQLNKNKKTAQIIDEQKENYDRLPSLYVKTNQNEEHIIEIKKQVKVDFKTGVYVYGNIEELGMNDSSKAVK